MQLTNLEQSPLLLHGFGTQIFMYFPQYTPLVPKRHSQDIVPFSFSLQIALFLHGLKVSHFCWISQDLPA